MVKENRPKALIVSVADTVYNSILHFPAGIAAIAGHLKECGYELKSEIIEMDTQLVSLQSIINQINITKPENIFISTKSGSIKDFQLLGKEISLIMESNSNYNPRILIGGNQAILSMPNDNSLHPINLMEGYSNAYICYGRGEITAEKFLGNVPVDKIPNLIHPQTKHIKLNPDKTHFSEFKYVPSTILLKPIIEGKGIVYTETSQGCTGGVKGTCSFCAMCKLRGISGKKLQVEARSAEDVAKIFKTFYEAGANDISLADDNAFGADPEYNIEKAKAIANLGFKDLRFSMSARFDAIYHPDDDPRTASLKVKALKENIKAGMSDIFLGMDNLHKKTLEVYFRKGLNVPNIIKYYANTFAIIENAKKELNKEFSISTGWILFHHLAEDISEINYNLKMLKLTGWNRFLYGNLLNTMDIFSHTVYEKMVKAAGLTGSPKPENPIEWDYEYKNEIVGKIAIIAERWDDRIYDILCSLKAACISPTSGDKRELAKTLLYRVEQLKLDSFISITNPGLNEKEYLKVIQQVETERLNIIHEIITKLKNIGTIQHVGQIAIDKIKNVIKNPYLAYKSPEEL